MQGPRVAEHRERERRFLGRRPLGGDRLRRSTWIVLLVTLVALASADVASSKEIVTTACGRDRCRTVSNGVSGIALLPTRVRAPSHGRFYTVAVRITANGESKGWKVVYEARRQIVLAANESTRSLLGSRWCGSHQAFAPHIRAPSGVSHRCRHRLVGWSRRVVDTTAELLSGA